MFYLLTGLHLHWRLPDFFLQNKNGIPLTSLKNLPWQSILIGHSETSVTKTIENGILVCGEFVVLGYFWGERGYFFIE